jgi:diaminopimelate decarboxylase
MLELFPDTAAVEDGELAIGGVRCGALAKEHGTPLFVYCEATLRGQARAYRAAAPGALVAYGSKAFPNLALLRLFADEGLGADVSTLGELTLALRAGIAGERLIVHGNNKDDDELRAAADAGAGLVVLDSLDEVERAAEAGIRRVLVRVTSGIEADTHDAIRTGHHGSKFGLDPDDALETVRMARELDLDVAGLHVHVGSQLVDARAHLTAVELLAAFSARCRDELGWTPATVDVGGGFGVRHVSDEAEPPAEALLGAVVDAVAREWAAHGLAMPRLIVEPGRALVGPAAFTLYRIGSVKRAGDRRYVAIDGGMSDNPRPQLYNARYTALLANRAEEPAEDAFTIVGKHCESGDVLIHEVELPAPRRGDLLAVPVTGAYTLAMSSTYNGVPRPAAVLVGSAGARLILRRETIDDLLAREA